MAVSEQAFELLRGRVTDVERSQAVREETLKNVETRLKNIEAILSRLTWMIVFAIGSAALTFIISGGFHVPGH